MTSQPDFIPSFKLSSFQIYWLNFSLVYCPCSILRFLTETKQFFSPRFPLLISTPLSNKSWFHCPFPREVLPESPWLGEILLCHHCIAILHLFDYLVNIFLLHYIVSCSRAGIMFIFVHNTC